jgi:galactokinase
VEEIARVVQAVAALHEGNLALFGTLMNDSHNSLQ